DLSKPQTESRLAPSVRKVPFEFRHGVLKIVAGPEHVESASECEHRLNHVLLVPLVVFGPLPRIIVWEPDVVSMNQDPGRQTGNQAQIEKHDVAPGSGQMAGVNEKNVAGLQPARKLVYTKVFHGSRVYRVGKTGDIDPGVGIDRNDSGCSFTIDNSLAYQPRAIARSNLDNRLRPLRSDNGIQDLSVR